MDLLLLDSFRSPESPALSMDFRRPVWIRMFLSALAQQVQNIIWLPAGVFRVDNGADQNSPNVHWHSDLNGVRFLGHFIQNCTLTTTLHFHRNLTKCPAYIHCVCIAFKFLAGYVWEPRDLRIYKGDLDASAQHSSSSILFLHIVKWHALITRDYPLKAASFCSLRQKLPREQMQRLSWLMIK